MHVISSRKFATPFFVTRSKKKKEEFEVRIEIWFSDFKVRFKNTYQNLLTGEHVGRFQCFISKYLYLMIDKNYIGSITPEGAVF